MAEPLQKFLPGHHIGKKFKQILVPDFQLIAIIQIHTFQSTEHCLVSEI